MLNHCQPGAYTAGARSELPDQPWRYNWGRAYFGCNNLYCPKCRREVTSTLTRSKRRYSCDCWRDYAYDDLDCLGEERYEGPMDYPVNRPDWICAGHPPRPVEGPEPATPTSFHELDEAYNSWRGTPRAERIALEFAKIAGRHKEASALFYKLNPGAPGREVLLHLKPTLKVAERWCQALAASADDSRFRDRLRELVLCKGFTTAAAAVMEDDRDWLRAHAEELLQVDAQVAGRLCDLLAQQGYGWNVDALRTLPIEIMRKRAATMGRNSLGLKEAEAYWELDYDWIVANYARLQEKHSDFGSYIKDFLDRKGWTPDPATLAVWRRQAMRDNDSYNAIPHLARWDREWVEESLAEILAEPRSVRGVWVVDQLRMQGSQRVPQLLEIVKLRTPDDCRL